MEAEALYRQIGRLLETAPDFSGYGPLSKDQLTWLGRAHALVSTSGDIIAKAEFDLASKNVQGALRQEAIQQIVLTLYKVLGAAELKAPAGVKGAFIPVGNSFDAFAALAKVLQTATKDILIVDLRPCTSSRFG